MHLAHRGPLGTSNVVALRPGLVFSVVGVEPIGQSALGTPLREELNAKLLLPGYQIATAL